MNLTIIAIVIATSFPLASTPLIAQQAAKSAKSTDERVQQESADNEKQILEIMQLQADAWNAGDLEGFMQPYWKSPELTFSSGGKTTRGWQATLDRYKNSYDTPEKMGQLKFDHLQFQQLTPQVALVLGQWHLTRTKDAPQGNFSLVLKSIDGAWKIVHDHSSTLEDPESGNDDNASDDQ